MDHRPTRQRRTNRPASVTSEPAGQPESEIAVPEFPTGTLWHYTTPAGLLGILGNVDDKPEDGKPRPAPTSRYFTRPQPNSSTTSAN